MRNPVRILSIDGGGIRGIIPATVLARLEKCTRRPVAKLFDLIAGTSTGGILALALTRPDSSGQPQYSAEALIEFYRKEGCRIFTRSFWHRLLAVGNLSQTKYPCSGIGGVLQQYFGETRLAEAVTDVLVPSYEIEQSFPFFFRSSMARMDPSYDFPMKDVARATSAAPTYFEPIKLAVENTNRYYALIDGGVYANNPAACALVEARSTHPLADGYLVVSLGTGSVTSNISYQEARNWGVAQWAKPILNVVFDGVSSTVDYQLRQLLLPCGGGSPQYVRLQPTLNAAQRKMDNTEPENIAALQAVASGLVESNSAEIEMVCDALVR